MKKLLIATLVSLCFMVAALAGLAFADQVAVRWDANAETDLAGYKLYMSTDNGVTWGPGLDVGNVIEYILTVPDSGLVLIRVSAYDDNGNESIAAWKGCWYNGNWRPLAEPREISGD